MAKTSEGIDVNEKIERLEKNVDIIKKELARIQIAIWGNSSFELNEINDSPDIGTAATDIRQINSISSESSMFLSEDLNAQLVQVLEACAPLISQDSIVQSMNTLTTNSTGPLQYVSEDCSQEQVKHSTPQTHQVLEECTPLVSQDSSVESTNTFLETKEKAAVHKRTGPFHNVSKECSQTQVELKAPHTEQHLKACTASSAQDSVQSKEPVLKANEESAEQKSTVRLQYVSEDCLQTFTQLKIRRKFRFVVFKIESSNTLSVEHTGTPEKGWKDFISCLPYTECRYAVYDHAYLTYDKRKSNKLFFICWLPLNSNPHSKMAYTTGKMTVRERMQGVLDLNAQNIEELEVAVGIKEDSDGEVSDIDSEG